MRKMLNVLYVTTPDAFLAKEGENLVVKVDDKEIFRTPIHYLEGVVTFGYKGASPTFFGMYAERGVTITFLTEYGKFLARVSGPVKGNVLLRRRQYRIADSESDCTKLASRLIIGKLANCRAVLRRFLSDHASKDNASHIETVRKDLAKSIVKLSKASSLEEIRVLKERWRGITFQYLMP